MSEWINIKNKLPSPADYVLVWDGFLCSVAQIQSWEKTPGVPLFCSYDSPSFEITHWMPLPEPPHD